MKRSEIKVTVTFGDILDSGRWDRFCMQYGINEWCINEGQADRSSTQEIRLTEAEDWGIIEKD